MVKHLRVYCVTAFKVLKLELTEPYIGIFFFSWHYNPHWGLYFTAL